MRENDLLEHIYRHNTSLPAHVSIPPGDDMAALDVGGTNVLVAVDQLADGIHFDLKNTPLQKVARKAITRNLSDIAAMAAQPVAAVVAGSLPKDFGKSNADALFDAMHATAEHYQCPLVGGDIAIWAGPLLLTVTVLAEPAGVEPVTRRGTKVGDVVCITGQLGGSLETVNGRTHHLDFEPRLSVARALAGDENLRPTSMIDLSDGLAMDVSRLCRLNAVGVELWADRLPVRAAGHQAAHRDQRPPWMHALSDGEDYELAFTLSAQAAEHHLPAEIEGVPITQVGLIIEGDDLLIKQPDGTVVPLDALGAMGWEHQSNG